MNINTVVKLARLTGHSLRTFQSQKKGYQRLLATSLNNISRFSFCATKINVEQLKKQDVEQMAFKTETKKLLDIVAKSLYTDKEVFLRELLSNASDAIEKQRFLNSQKDNNDDDDFKIQVECNTNKRQIIISDNGVGFTRDQLINDLGTIARSGSQQFVKEVGKGSADNIIGQFGVGFYSSFIVGDSVQVISKSEKESQAHMWQSDGNGEFEISTVGDCGFKRGTRIIIHLRPECQEFSKAEDVKKIIQKYSNFINFPISVNGERFNLVQAIWTRSKFSVTEEEYVKFWEYISNQKMKYFAKLHYEVDVPLNIKSLLYIPAAHAEKMGFSQEQMAVSLYCKKVLIKANCQELLPNWLRFVKGVVDCEDLPLNISRENYQDSSLIQKLKQVVTKRVLKFLDEEANKNPAEYNKWFQDFQFFIKEGLAMDVDYQEQLFKLCRFNVDYSKDLVSLEDYVSKMKPGQQKIYYALLPNRESADSSPFIEPFKGTGIPIIYTFINIDEMIYQTVGSYKGFQFVNVEGDFNEISQDIKKFKKDTKTETKSDTQSKMDSDEITPFCLWVKNELQPIVTKVVVSERLTNSPAIVQSQMSSAMRQMVMMMEQNNVGDISKNLTMEINPNHELIYKINEVRKQDQQTASLILRQLCDNCMVTAGIPTDPKRFNDRIQNMMSKILDNIITSKDSNAFASRSQADSKVEEGTVYLDENGNPKIK
ncbi:heat shock protein HSP90 (macronuclear) [Tetrahymena thermophila SB210]|uniref:Heat shock protein HSP90 n=1 Tax=Tetrahymena thermophila (strain SB210) TaxID=312017 RepID=Q23FL2_TETTS|nr:heat shock protein HSP90 [Tetrahymena thermophila SB210]EAR95598.1 heat shock protein HSP90 [Tetrahymena thermophila SB210]|eukprot:XP_001015843.1 heat shock protein HSP90 [Tetrahymena thermophila SB210]